MVKRFYIHKVDLDTCLTALVLGISSEDQVTILPGSAAPRLLADPESLCIEVGGSGQVELNNFDHHDESRFFPPACRQAFACRSSHNSRSGLERLVDYVSLVDDPPAEPLKIQYPSLSNLFSGMLMQTLQSDLKFQRGLELLNTVLDQGYDPFAPLSRRPEWRLYLAAKEDNNRRLAESGVIAAARYFTTAGGLKAGFISLSEKDSDLIVGPGVLYGEGCDIAVVFSPAFGEPPVRKFTIAGRERPVNHLLPHLARLEPGWGGREKIIGSPQKGGSFLQEKTIIELVRNHV